MEEKDKLRVIEGKAWDLISNVLKLAMERVSFQLWCWILCPVPVNLVTALARSSC